MRILTVGNGYPPHHHGGAELIWESAVDHLRESGHDARVLTIDLLLDDKGPDPPWVHRDLRWRLKGGRFEEIGLRQRAVMARHNHAVLDHHLDEFAPEVIAWWSMGGLSLTMLETVRRRGIPSAAFVLDEWVDYGRWADAWSRTFSGPRRSRAAGIAERIAGIPAAVDLGTATKYAFISEFTRAQAEGLGLGLRDTAVLHSGIHKDFLDPSPVREWRWRLLYVGRIDTRKGIDTAIESLALLPPEASLNIAGSWDPVEEDRLRAAAAELGVEDRVVFAGQLDRPELVAIYGEADALVFPVRWNEPWGLVPLEGMARGVPVLATGRGGSAEYLRDEENCLLFEADDARALASATQRLADSAELRLALREDGIRTAAKYTERAYNERVEETLVEAASRNAAAVAT